MADARHFCPDCGGIDLQIDETTTIITLEGSKPQRTAQCPNCSWSGPLTATIGAVTTEQFWDFKRVGDVLMRVIGRHAAGPFVQVMEFVGLLPRPYETPPKNADGSMWSPTDLRTHNRLVREAREEILRAMIGAAIAAGFETAEKWHRIWAVQLNQPLHQVLREDQQPTKKEREFGGN